MTKLTLPRSFAVTRPYGHLWLEEYYRRNHQDLYGRKVSHGREFRELLASCDTLPEMMLMGNFIPERAAIAALCRQHGINRVHTEDGFFPHYTTLHADPIGFCWESSLPGLVFRECSARQREVAETLRCHWLDFQRAALPDLLQTPFVLWPLQLIGDKVNTQDINVPEWTALIRHFRHLLPQEYTLVLKEHPRSKEMDNIGLSELVRQFPNIILLPKSTDLKTLLTDCAAVAGVNSSALFEARLIFRKPVYAYGRGWFTNHIDLFTPLVMGQDYSVLPAVEAIVDNGLLRTELLDDYADWFLAQLLARQITREQAESSPEQLRQWVSKLSFESYLCYGEEIFL